MFRVIAHNVSLLRFRPPLDFIHAFISWETVAVRWLLDKADLASPWTALTTCSLNKQLGKILVELAGCHLGIFGMLRMFCKHCH